MHRFVIVLGLLVGKAASAETRVVVRPTDGLAFVQGIIGDDQTAATSARVQSRLIYLNKNGVKLAPGSNDARNDRSSIVKDRTSIPAWNPDPALWSETVACLREVFAPFDVRFTETDPGDTSHIEAVFGGNAALIGLPVRAGGASPMSTSCKAIENSIVFAFTDDLPDTAKAICEVMAQEIGHSYGLDHELLASDPMTYLSYAGKRGFQDTFAECGELSPRTCGVPGYTKCRDQQNSYALLLERLGPATVDDDPPNPTAVADDDHAEIGCSTSSRPGVFAIVVVLAAFRRRRRG